MRGGDLTDNVAKNNNATGFEVSAGVISVTLTDNTAKGNRQAFCDGTATKVAVDGGDNNFGFPGPACDAIA
jgi:parallel beta-helix repeat protein